MPPLLEALPFESETIELVSDSTERPEPSATLALAWFENVFAELIMSL